MSLKYCKYDPKQTRIKHLFYLTRQIFAHMINDKRQFNWNQVHRKINTTAIKCNKTEKSHDTRLFN